MGKIDLLNIFVKSLVNMSEDEYSAYDEVEEFSPPKQVAYRKGELYLGTIEDGIKTGSGIYQMPNGQKYAGGFFNDKYNGRGQFENKKITYDGDFKDGQFHGYGRATYPDGRIQMGRFGNGKLNGYGRKIKDLKTFCEGFFKEGKLDGIGVEVYKSKDVYIGQFTKGVKNGIGFYFFNKGGCYQGQFNDDNQSGYGFLVKKNINEIYSGYWDRNRRDGRGFEQFKDGSVYDGFYKNGKREGPGIMKYPNGVMYMGEWKEGLKHGLGRLEKRDDDAASYSTGRFENDVYLNVCELNQKPLLKYIGGTKVYKTFEVFLEAHPQIIADYLQEFKVLDFGNLKKLQQFLYPDVQKWLKNMTLENYLDTNTLGRIRNFLNGAKDVVTMFKMINLSFGTFNFKSIENIHKNCLCESYAQNAVDLKWVGWIYTSYDPKPFKIDHMVISKDQITGHSKADANRTYKYSGVALEDGTVKIYENISGGVKVVEYDQLWCSFYLCGYKRETHEKIFIMPEVTNKWWGYCTLNKEKEKKKVIELSFGIHNNRIFGIGFDKVGCYSISGVLNDISTPDRPFQYKCQMKQMYVDGWIIFFDGVLWQKQIKGNWYSSANYGKFCVRLSADFNAEEYLITAKKFLVNGNVDFDIDFEKNCSETRHLTKSILYYLFEGSYQEDSKIKSMNDEMKIYSEPPEPRLNIDTILTETFSDKERCFIVQEPNDDLKLVKGEEALEYGIPENWIRTFFDSYYKANESKVDVSQINELKNGETSNIANSNNQQESIVLDTQKTEGPESPIKGDRTQFDSQVEQDKTGKKLTKSKPTSHVRQLSDKPITTPVNTSQKRITRDKSSGELSYAVSKSNYGRASYKKQEKPTEVKEKFPNQFNLDNYVKDVIDRQDRKDRIQGKQTLKMAQKKRKFSSFQRTLFDLPYKVLRYDDKFYELPDIKEQLNEVLPMNYTKKRAHGDLIDYEDRMILDQDIQSDFHNLYFSGKFSSFSTDVPILFTITEIGLNYFRATLIKNDHVFRLDGCYTAFLQARIFDNAEFLFGQLENNYFDETEKAQNRLTKAFGFDVFDQLEFIGDSPTTDYGFWAGGYIDKDFDLVMNISRFHDTSTPQGLQNVSFVGLEVELVFEIKTTIKTQEKDFMGNDNYETTVERKTYKGKGVNLGKLFIMFFIGNNLHFQSSEYLWEHEGQCEDLDNPDAQANKFEMKNPITGSPLHSRRTVTKNKPVSKRFIDMQNKHKQNTRFQEELDELDVDIREEEYSSEDDIMDEDIQKPNRKYDSKKKTGPQDNRYDDTITKERSEPKIHANYVGEKSSPKDKNVTPTDKKSIPTDKKSIQVDKNETPIDKKGSHRDHKNGTIVGDGKMTPAESIDDSHLIKADGQKALEDTKGSAHKAPAKHKRKGTGNRSKSKSKSKKKGKSPSKSKKRGKSKSKSKARSKSKAKSKKKPSKKTKSKSKGRSKSKAGRSKSKSKHKSKSKSGRSKSKGKGHKKKSPKRDPSKESLSKHQSNKVSQSKIEEEKTKVNRSKLRADFGKRNQVPENPQRNPDKVEIEKSPTKPRPPGDEASKNIAEKHEFPEGKSRRTIARYIKDMSNRVEAGDPLTEKLNELQRAEESGIIENKFRDGELPLVDLKTQDKPPQAIMDKDLFSLIQQTSTAQAVALKNPQNYPNMNPKDKADNLDKKDNKPITPFSKMFDPVQNTGSSQDNKKREDKRNLYAGLPRKNPGKDNSKHSLHTDGSVDMPQYLKHDSQSRNTENDESNVGLTAGQMKLTVGGAKAKTIKAADTKDAVRKLWKDQLNEARMKKAKQNKWYYTTRYDQNDPEIKEPSIKDPTIPVFEHNNMTKSLNKDFSTDKFNNPGAIKVDNYSSNDSRRFQKKDAISERELNLLHVMQRFKSRNDDLKTYDEDFYMWQANNPFTFRMIPFCIEYEENTDRLDHIDFYVNDNINLSVTFLE